MLAAAAQIAQDRALMIDLLKVNQKLRAGVAMRRAWEGLDDATLTEDRDMGAEPPEPWHAAVAAAQLSWQQVRPIRNGGWLMCQRNVVKMI